MEKIRVSVNDDALGKIFAISDALNLFFQSKQVGPYEIVARLLEEAGELSTEVSRLEDNGIKRAKGIASRAKRPMNC